MAEVHPEPSRPVQPPPAVRIGVVQWVHKNLFSTWYNGLLTIILLWALFRLVVSLGRWAIQTAEWAVIAANFRLFFVGRYPPELTWRIWVVLAMVAFLAGLSWRQWLGGSGSLVYTGFWLRGQNRALGRMLPLLWVLSFPISLWLVGGGWVLAPADTSLWGGLLLTLLLAVAGIVGSFPFGVLLALGRQSTLPVVRWFSIIYIEVVRGVPLIGLLFMALIMLPLMMPPDIRFGLVPRAITAFVLFTAAYLAETVRGGLQAIPRGQVEAAKALGLKGPLVVLLVVLPQALRNVIPAIVGQFISLFKDTTLAAALGFAELLGISNSILANPSFLGRFREVYLFIGVMYWVFCYSMSVASRRLEQRLGVGQR